MTVAFDHVGEWAASPDEGRYAFGTIRKVPSQASTSTWWVDLSMAAGIPKPNYYAAEPLVAATLDPLEGILHGTTQTGTKRLASWCLMSPTAGFVGHYSLLDYLLFYPFVDGDETAAQLMDNTVTLPRYTDGEGVMAMAVALAPTSGGGEFTFDYVNQDGDTVTSPSNYCVTASANITNLVTSTSVNGSFGPFLRLAAGDTGIRRIESVTFISASGGLMAFVLVRRLAALAIREVNTPAEVELVSSRPAPEIKDGAYLGMIVNCAGTVASGTLAGWIETYFSEED